MKNLKVVLVTVSLSSSMMLASCKDSERADAPEQATEDKQITLNTLDDKLSYLMGYSSAQQVAQSGLTLNPEIVRKAIEDAKNGIEPLLSDEEIHAVSSEYQRVAQEQRMLAAREANLKLGAEYLASNANRQGVEQTASGIQYEVLKSASGAATKPQLTDKVKVNYHGTLLNGQVFDSSIESGAPVIFPVNQVIPGWTEVLQLMSVGEKWRVVIPSELAYPDGTRSIPPGSTLIFEIDLLAINPES